MNGNRLTGAAARSWWKFLPLVLVACAAVALGQTPELMVKDAWARPPLAPQNNTAVYMIIENPGASPRSIVSVSCADAPSAQIHEMMMEGKMAMMMPAKEVTVPAGGSVEFKTGGYHIMLSGVKKPVKAGDHLNLVLKLSDGKTVPVTATVRDSAPDPAPSGGQSMPGMK
jgi:periplasmic copper chaperone A